MYFTALDIGSSQIKALVAESKKDSKKLSIVGVFKSPSSGIRKGEVASPEEVVQSLNGVLKEIKSLNKSAVKNIFIGVNGPNIKIHHSRGIVAVSRADNEIYSDDIERAVKASEAINLNRNRTILHTITQEFVVDGIGDIRDPLGMAGNRLEVNSLIVEGFKQSINNLTKSVEVAGGSIGGMVYNPLAAARAVVSKSQKELGAVMIDIGWGTISMAVYEEDKLLLSAVFPMGCGNITNDLAIGLKCSVSVAEKVKLSFGCASAKEISNKEKIDLSQIDNSLKNIVNRKFISEIIEIRLAEIFELVNNELKLINKAGRLPAGAIITGGGAKMPGIYELAKYELRLPIQIGVPEKSDFEIVNPEWESLFEDAEFSVAAGLLALNAEQSSKERSWISLEKAGFQRL